MRLLHDAAQPQLALHADIPPPTRRRRAARFLEAAGALLAFLERGEARDARILRETMTQAFGGNDNRRGTHMKVIGDFLGHRDPSSTAIYAKVNLAALREVAALDLEGLA